MALQTAADLFHPEACFCLAEMLSEAAGSVAGSGMFRFSRLGVLSRVSLALSYLLSPPPPPPPFPCLSNPTTEAETLYTSAATLYKTAAEQGHNLACESLATCYESGTGIKQSVVESEKWYQRAGATVEGEHAEAYEKAWEGYTGTPAPAPPASEMKTADSFGNAAQALEEEEKRQHALSTLLVVVKKQRHKAKRIGNEER